MTTIATILTLLVAVEHVYILVLEMFLWQTPRGLKAFHMKAAQAKATATLAANQGLYNGFLAAGLFWSLLSRDPLRAHDLRCFFLGCVVVAALYGGYSVNRRILWVQGLPAVLALATTLAF